MQQSEKTGAVQHKALLPLSIGALGVVFGDIGTSPLYTLQTCLSKEYGMPPSPANILGMLSLIFWTLILVTSVKYALFIMRADNRGEGGIMALLALALRPKDESPRMRWLFAAAGIFGASLFYGDSMITPAISVLSAIEGLEVAAPSLKTYVIPVTLVIILGLFLIQRTGTARMGTMFGPVMLLFFATIAALGVLGILRQPAVLAAVNPWHSVQFFMRHRFAAFVILGAVVLCVTGAEALYADMGHFGKTPIRIAWFWVVFPAVVLNYFGQGALVLTTPAAADNPFFRLAPVWSTYPMVVLSAAATVIASQSVISGAFSLGRQAVQLRYLPRMMIRYTSAKEMGQVYVPFINWVLLIAVSGLVIGFGSSTRLANAFGFSVTGTMVCTTFLALVVTHKLWKWAWWKTALAGIVFLTVDLAYFASNALKIHTGGWFPLTVGIGVFTLMSTWHTGRILLAKRIEAQSMALDAFLQSIAHDPPATVPGTAVYFTSNLEMVPQALLHNLKHYKVIHERNVFIRILSRDIPYVAEEDRLELVGLCSDFYRIRTWYGFQETPNIPDLLAMCKSLGLAFDMMDTSFFLSREIVIPSREIKGMALWREKLFAWMVRNSMNAAKFFSLPINRVIELGGQIEI